MQQALAPARKYAPAVYWLFFACFCSIAATYPPYLPASLGPAPYPLRGVAIAWVVMGLLIWWRVKLLMPATKEQMFWRVIQRTAHIAILLVLLQPSFYTDQGGLVSAIALFTLSELIILFARFLSERLSSERINRKAPKNQE